jgi:hypothetical protein
VWPGLFQQVPDLAGIDDLYQMPLALIIFRISTYLPKKPRVQLTPFTETQNNSKMCYYTQTHVHCGHDEKLPVDSSQCTCTLNNPKITDIVDASENGLGESEGRCRSKYGMFKGETQPVKESWCPKCLVGQKAKVYDQVNAGSFGSILNKAINPGGFQIHPAKIHTKKPKSSEHKAEKKEEGMAVNEDMYMVPKWGTQWEDKTRSEMRREIREGKMETVDQIRVLRDIVTANGMTTNELEQRIQTQTDERKAAEQKKKDDAEQERQGKIKKIEDGLHKERLEKARKKAANILEHLERLAESKSRVLMRV